MYIYIHLYFQCYETFNNETANNSSTKQWPLCSVQMTSVMLAAKDSDTCMRRNKLVTNLNEGKFLERILIVKYNFSYL